MTVQEAQSQQAAVEAAPSCEQKLTLALQLIGSLIARIIELETPATETSSTPYRADSNRL